MALITKIRRNFWFVLLLIGFALAAFLIMDVTSGPMGGSQGPDVMLGSINGEKIGYNEYQITEGAYYSGSGGDLYAKRASIWDYFVERSLINSQAKDLGISVGKDELMDLQFGANPSPIIQQNWAQNMQQLGTIKASIENEEEMNPQFRQYWAEQEKQIIKQQKQNKIGNMISKAIYTPSWMAEEAYKEDNTTVDFQYVRIPFENIDEQVSLTDADFSNFINANPTRFTEKVETRTIKYAVMDVVASSQDSADIMVKMNDLLTNFRATDNDSLFVTTNTGVYPGSFLKVDQMPETMKERITTMANGEIYGPYLDQGAYNLFKVIDQKNVPDSVNAQHILRNADPNNTIQMAAAESYIDSLINRYNRGAERFDSLAVKNSQDASNAFNGGDLGTFVQGRMVKEFNDVCFLTGREGNVYKVKTQFGVHAIKINDQVYNDSESEYKIAMVGLPIVPSENTQNEMYDQVSDLVINNRDQASIVAACQAKGLSFESSGPLKENDYIVGALGTGQTSRDMVKFAFDPVAEVGDISQDVHTYTDPVNYYNNKYVIAVLDGINKAGIQPVSAVKDQIQGQVMNQKKAEALISKLNISSLEDLAGQYETEMKTATNVNLSAPFVGDAGAEAEVVALAFATQEQAVSKPIIGNKGVYVVKPMSKAEAGAPVNLPGVKSSLSTTMKSQVAFKMMEALKNKAKIEDERSTYF